MKILVVGNGGREHTLLWKLRRDAPAAQLFVTQGNGGTDTLAAPIPLVPTDVAGLASWAEAEGIDLTVVGPEAPLEAGICDVFQARGLAVFGPTRAAAAIETSKAYSKALMVRAGVRTAGYEVFTDLAEAESHIGKHGAPLVVKASGLAAGKGAVVCETVAGALEAARAMLDRRVFGDAGRKIVVEEFLAGEEVSVFGIADGHDVLIMCPAQDHKRIGDGDNGPNTGGMGAYAPVSLLDEAALERIRHEVFVPTLQAMREDGNPYEGLLYAGLILTAEGIEVIEFNARFGDPETQALLPLLSSSLLEPLLAVANGERLRGRLEWRRASALTTVLASAGYPGTYASGFEISIPEQTDGEDEVFVFHAGTRREGERLVTSGGRVLAVTGVADELATAASLSRAMAQSIQFDGKQYRTDIGWRELERQRARTT